mmetsp:Transcript_11703/g.23577  ORF Transcript_11703/g.23577 Transcript_11703/m.23577 type:complete len:203 (-) Transcript_11703:443-1051(-)
MWPVLRLYHRPVHVPALDALVDLVQVGNQPDSVMMMLTCVSPCDARVVRCLVLLRIYLCEKLGGRSVDFNLVASPRGDGSFIIAFAPIAAMTNGPDGYLNPSTGEVLDATALPCATVDSSQGKGNMLTYSPDAHTLAMEGRPIIQRLYDFNRILGARMHICEYMRDRYGLDFGASTGRTLTVCKPIIEKSDQTIELFGDEAA